MELNHLNPAQHFEKMYHDPDYRKNIGWGTEYKSGMCCSLEKTVEIRNQLPKTLKQLNIKSLLDLPCGDWTWMQDCDLGDISYIGGDIVGDLIEENKKKFPDADFRVLNIINGKLPKTDAILVRDLWSDLPNRLVYRSIQNIKESGIRWLIATNYPDILINYDTAVGVFRPHNLCIKPFNLRRAIGVSIPEWAPAGGKCLEFWDLG